MEYKKRNILMLFGILVMVCFSVFASASTADAAVPGSWTGDPDPYACNTFLDCYWTLPVCITGRTHEVGIYYDPTGVPKKNLELDALSYGTKLSAGNCGFSFTGRWVHSYVGNSWTCNLVSESDSDKNAPRFSDINYVKETCGDHPLYGPFDGTADYQLCREKNADGILYCGNNYDSSK